MVRVITVASQKGGAGKTSLLIHLGVALAQAGRSVALLDTDPQGSLSRWFAVRKGVAPSVAIGFAQAEGWKVATAAQALGRDADIVLIDTPPHAETAARTAIRAGGQVLVPLQPSPLDLWASEKTVEIAQAEQIPVAVVLNRVPPRSKLTDQMAAVLADQGVRVASVRLGNRTAFAAAILRGLGITEAEPRSKAADEMRALAEALDQGGA